MSMRPVPDGLFVETAPDRRCARGNAVFRHRFHLIARGTRSRRITRISDTGHPLFRRIVNYIGKRDNPEMALLFLGTYSNLKGFPSMFELVFNCALVHVGVTIMLPDRLFSLFVEGNAELKVRPLLGAAGKIYPRITHVPPVVENGLHLVLTGITLRYR